MRYKEERPAEDSAGRFVCTVQATINSDRAGNFAGTQAPGTNIYMARRAVDHCLHALDIGLPGTIGASVGVRNLDTEGHALIAELALCHPLHLLAVRNSLAYIASNRYLSRLRRKMQALFDKNPKKFCQAAIHSHPSE